MSKRDFLKILAGIGLGAAFIEVYEKLYNIPALERRFRSEVNYWMNEYNSAKGMVEKLSEQINVSKNEISRLSGEVNNWKNQYNVVKEEVNRLGSTLNALDALEKESTAAISFYRERMEEARRRLENTIEKYRSILGDERVSFESSTLKVLEDLKITQEKLLKVLSYFPLIKSLEYKPAKVVHDKIYDLDVNIEVISPLNTLKEVEVSLIPVEYRYFITTYGMREEDYDKVFPKEEVKSIKIEPRQLEREMFSVTFSDLKGGREYQVKVRVKDAAGNIRQEQLDIPYVREFENIAPLDDIVITASYEPWSFKDTPMKDETPLLGRYDTNDDMVIWRHIDWAGSYGIDCFLIDGEYVINGDRFFVPEKFLEKGMKIGIVLGPTSEFLRNTTENFPEWAIDLGYSYNYEVFLNKMKAIASTWANHPNYLRIDGKPLIFIYDSIAFLNTSQAFKTGRELFKQITGSYPFILADEVQKIPLTPEDVSYLMKYKDFSQIDGITGWAGLLNRNEEVYVSKYENFYDKQLSVWFEFAKKNNLGFVPTVIPGFDNSYSWGPPGLPPIERDPEKFRERLEIANKHIDKKLNMIRVDTFNDFGEWSYIEPSTKDKFTYLETLRNFLKTRK